MSTYNEEFYSKHRDSALSSAREIVPIVLQFVQPHRVIDVGCGDGSWLSVFREYGVEDVWGVDGSYVSSDVLQIPQSRFISHDLSSPLFVDGEFDLAVSLEVAEHLREDSTETYIHSLTRLAPLILFSAAVPHQGGTSHVNEQWPEYWRDLFQARGYVAVDCIRGRVWQNRKVEWWYAQNTLVFAREDYLNRNARLKEEFERTNQSKLSLIHPQGYLNKVGLLEHFDPENRSLKDTISTLPGLTKKAVFKRLRK